MVRHSGVRIRWCRRLGRFLSDGFLFHFTEPSYERPLYCRPHEARFLAFLFFRGQVLTMFLDVSFFHFQSALDKLTLGR